MRCIHHHPRNTVHKEIHLGKVFKAKECECIAYMESTVDFDFYSSSLLQTCFIVFGTFSSKTPKQVFFNPINIFDSFSFTLVNHNRIILKDLHRLRIVDIQERITEKVQVQLQNQKTTMLLLCMVQIK